MSSDLSTIGLQPAVTQAIQQVLSGFDEISQVILYGSRAMGTYRTGSDIDITIKLKPNIKPSITLLSQISMAIDDLDLIYSFDISFIDEIDNPDLIRHIEEVGLQFYP